MSFVDFDAWIMRRFLSEASIIMTIFLPICFAHLSSFVSSYNDRSTYDLSIHCAVFQQPIFFLIPIQFFIFIYSHLINTLSKSRIDIVEI